jgi:hypothetical protein
MSERKEDTLTRGDIRKFMCAYFTPHGDIPPTNSKTKSIMCNSPYNGVKVLGTKEPSSMSPGTILFCNGCVITDWEMVGMRVTLGGEPQNLQIIDREELDRD